MPRPSGKAPDAATCPDLVADALRAACRVRRPAGPVVLRSSRGCQYIGRDFADLAGEFGVKLSFGRTGQCWDTRSLSRSPPR